VNDTDFVPPLPVNLQDHRNLITAAVALVNRDMLTGVWNETDYRIDICRVSKGGHIQHLRNVQKKLGIFTFYRRKKYHDPLRNIFVPNL
jgi:hypothetical protein